MGHPYHPHGAWSAMGQIGAQINGNDWQSAQAAHGYPAQVAGYSPGLYQALAQQNALASLAGIAQPVREEPLEDAGITVGEIIGWRVWRVTRGYLTSTSMDTVWLPGDTVSGEPRGRHGAGVHAWKTEALAVQYALLTSGPVVVGRVALWGEVIEHESGFRAEFARIESLDYPLSLGWWARRKLRRKYACVFAQGSEAEGGDAEGGSVHERPVAEGDAP